MTDAAVTVHRGSGVSEHRHPPPRTVIDETAADRAAIARVAMGLLQKHAILTAVGLVLSVLAIAWLQPNETGGTTLVVVFLLILVNAVGAIFIRTGPTGGE